MDTFDLVTGTWTDLDGTPHLADPISYIRMLGDFQSAADITADMRGRIAELPKERMEVRKKYKEVASLMHEPQQPTGIGRRKAAPDMRVEKFMFNPLSAVSKQRKK